MAAAAAAAGQPPPGLGPRGALAGRMRFPGQYFMWSSFFSWAIIPGVGFESFNNPRIGISKSLTTAQSKPVRSRPPSYQTHSWTKRQKPAKNVIEKIREIQWSYLCLQRFDKFWIWSKYNLRKWKLCEFTETCREKLVNLFLPSFSLLEPLWGCAWPFLPVCSGRYSPLKRPLKASTKPCDSLTSKDRQLFLF